MLGRLVWISLLWLAVQHRGFALHQIQPKLIRRWQSPALPHDTLCVELRSKHGGDEGEDPDIIDASGFDELPQMKLSDILGRGPRPGSMRTTTARDLGFRV